jgi:hypothetical protein
MSHSEKRGKGILPLPLLGNNKLYVKSIFRFSLFPFGIPTALCIINQFLSADARIARSQTHNLMHN